VSRAVSTRLPVFVERAGGGVLVDADGNSLIDFGPGIAVVSVGNAADEVVAGVRDQVGRFTHTCFMITPYEGYVAVCEELAARAFTGRQAVVAFDHTYHGRTNLTMAVTAKPRRLPSSGAWSAAGTAGGAGAAMVNGSGGPGRSWRSSANMYHRPKMARR
jgi:4-aminobutyrate aminotransferase-like enzyme